MVTFLSHCAINMGEGGRGGGVRSIRGAALVLCVWKSGALQQTELRH